MKRLKKKWLKNNKIIIVKDIDDHLTGEDFFVGFENHLWKINF